MSDLEAVLANIESIWTLRRNGRRREPIATARRNDNNDPRLAREKTG